MSSFRRWHLGVLPCVGHHPRLTAGLEYLYPGLIRASVRADKLPGFMLAVISRHLSPKLVAHKCGGLFVPKRTWNNYHGTEPRDSTVEYCGCCSECIDPPYPTYPTSADK